MKPPGASPALPASFLVLMIAACSPTSNTEPSDTDTATNARLQGAIDRSGLGEVIATIGGAAYRGQTLDVPSEGTSTAEFRDLGPVNTISLQAHDPEAESVMRNVLNIDFSLAGDDSSAPISSPTVSYFPDGMNEPFYSSEGMEPVPQVTLGTLSLEDGAASISGQFAANICRKSGFFSEPDKGDCMTVEGNFETALRKSS